MHRYLILLVIALPTSSGCVAIYTRQPVDVLVLNAETGEPIPEAVVGVSNTPLGVDLFWASVVNKPERVEATTDKQGRAEIAVAKFRGINWGVRSPSYLPSGVYGLNNELVVPPKYQANEGQQICRHAVIRLYREPAPTVSVVVPDGFRGPLLIEEHETEDSIQGAIGQRDFVFRANQSGYVRIDSTALLSEHFDGWLSLPVCYASGATVPQDEPSDPPDHVAVTWITTNYPQQQVLHVYFIGTQAEAEQFEESLYTVKGESRSQNAKAIEKLFAEARQGDVLHWSKHIQGADAPRSPTLHSKPCGPYPPWLP